MFLRVVVRKVVKLQMLVSLDISDLSSSLHSRIYVCYKVKKSILLAIVLLLLLLLLLIKFTVAKCLLLWKCDVGLVSCAAEYIFVSLTNWLLQSYKIVVAIFSYSFSLSSCNFSIFDFY